MRPGTASIAELLAEGRRRLATRAGSDAPRLAAELLLAHALGRPRSHLYAWPETIPTAEVLRRYRQLLAAHADGQPLAYLTGQREFWSLDLAVSPAVLIPRPDTETLVELALARIPRDAAWTLADLGTGSGAIALALRHERPHCQVLAGELDPAALAQAAANARRLGLDLALFRGHWGAALGRHSLDMLVSNPPYLAADDPHLQRGDLPHEPRQALVAGADGLDDLRRLAADARRLLRPGGWLLLEHGWQQGEAVADLLREAGLHEVAMHRDPAGQPRVCLGRA